MVHKSYIHLCYKKVCVYLCITYPHMSLYVFTSNHVVLLYSVQYYITAGYDLRKTADKNKIEA